MSRLYPTSCMMTAEVEFTPWRKNQKCPFPVQCFWVKGGFHLSCLATKRFIKSSCPLLTLKATFWAVLHCMLQLLTAAYRWGRYSSSSQIQKRSHNDHLVRGPICSGSGKAAFSWTSKEKQHTNKLFCQLYWCICTLWSEYFSWDLFFFFLSFFFSWFRCSKMYFHVAWGCWPCYLTVTVNHKDKWNHACIKLSRRKYTFEK